MPYVAQLLQIGQLQASVKGTEGKVGQRQVAGGPAPTTQTQISRPVKMQSGPSMDSCGHFGQMRQWHQDHRVASFITGSRKSSLQGI